MKIRIGNDLRLRVKLTTGSKSINVVQAHATIVRSVDDRQKAEDLRKKTRFFSRYPVEPIINSYIATEHNINCCGNHYYNVWPKTHCAAPYAGYGVHPFWKEIYPLVPECELEKFEAVVNATEQPDVIEIVFPAEFQHFTGDYDIIIVAKIYQPGYQHNYRTVTMDYRKAFTLVCDTKDEDRTNGIHIQVVEPGDNGNADYIYPEQTP